MKDLNKIMIIGHLGADPEMRFTEKGSPKTTFRVAANRTWKDEQGHTHEDTEWFRIVAWDRLAEVCNTYLSKGTRVYVEGRLRTRTWQGRYTTEVVAHDMIILSAKEPDPPSEMPTTTPERTAPATPQAGRRRGNVRSKAVPEEDLPF